MNHYQLTEPQRLALQSALEDRCKFERHAEPWDFINLLTACNLLGIECEDSEEQFKTYYPDSYMDFIGSENKDIDQRKAKRELKYRKQRLAEHRANGNTQGMIDLVVEANSMLKRASELQSK